MFSTRSSGSLSSFPADYSCQDNTLNSNGAAGKQQNRLTRKICSVEGAVTKIIKSEDCSDTKSSVIIPNRTLTKNSENRSGKVERDNETEALSHNYTNNTEELSLDEIRDLRLSGEENCPTPLKLYEINDNYFMPDGLVLGCRFIQMPSLEQIQAINRFQSENLVTQRGGIHNVGVFLNNNSAMLREGQLAGIYHGTQLRLKKININKGDLMSDKIHQGKYIQWSMSEVDGAVRHALTTRMPNFQSVNPNVSYKTANNEDVLLGIDAIDSTWPISNINCSDDQCYPNIILLPAIIPEHVVAVDEEGGITVSDNLPVMGAFCLLAIAIDEINPGEELIMDYNSEVTELPDDMSDYFFPDYLYFPNLYNSMIVQCVDNGKDISIKKRDSVSDDLNNVDKLPEYIQSMIDKKQSSVSIVKKINENGGWSNPLVTTQKHWARQTTGCLTPNRNVELNFGSSIPSEIEQLEPLSQQSHWNMGDLYVYCQLVNIKLPDVHLNTLTCLFYFCNDQGVLDNHGRNYLTALAGEHTNYLDGIDQCRTVKEIFLFLEERMEAISSRKTSERIDLLNKDIADFIECSKNIYYNQTYSPGEGVDRSMPFCKGSREPLPNNDSHRMIALTAKKPQIPVIGKQRDSLKKINRSVEENTFDRLLKIAGDRNYFDEVSKYICGYKFYIRDLIRNLNRWKVPFPGNDSIQFKESKLWEPGHICTFLLLKNQGAGRECSNKLRDALCVLQPASKKYKDYFDRYCLSALRQYSDKSYFNVSESSSLRILSTIQKQVEGVSCPLSYRSDPCDSKFGYKKLGKILNSFGVKVVGGMDSPDKKDVEEKNFYIVKRIKELESSKAIDSMEFLELIKGLISNYHKGGVLSDFFKKHAASIARDLNVKKIPIPQNDFFSVTESWSSAHVKAIFYLANDVPYCDYEMVLQTLRVLNPDNLLYEKLFFRYILGRLGIDDSNDVYDLRIPGNTSMLKSLGNVLHRAPIVLPDTEGFKKNAFKLHQKEGKLIFSQSAICRILEEKGIKCIVNKSSLELKSIKKELESLKADSSDYFLAISKYVSVSSLKNPYGLIKLVKRNDFIIPKNNVFSVLDKWRCGHIIYLRSCSESSKMTSEELLKCLQVLSPSSEVFFDFIRQYITNEADFAQQRFLNINSEEGCQRLTNNISIKLKNIRVPEQLRDEVLLDGHTAPDSGRNVCTSWTESLIKKVLVLWGLVKDGDGETISTEFTVHAARKRNSDPDTVENITPLRKIRRTSNTGLQQDSNDDFIDNYYTDSRMTVSSDIHSQAKSSDRWNVKYRQIIPKKTTEGLMNCPETLRNHLKCLSVKSLEYRALFDQYLLALYDEGKKNKSKEKTTDFNRYIMKRISDRLSTFEIPAEYRCEKNKSMITAYVIRQSLNHSGVDIKQNTGKNQFDVLRNLIEKEGSDSTTSFNRIKDYILSFNPNLVKVSNNLGYSKIPVPGNGFFSSTTSWTISHVRAIFLHHKVIENSNYSILDWAKDYRCKDLLTISLVLNRAQNLYEKVFAVYIFKFLNIQRYNHFFDVNNRDNVSRLETLEKDIVNKKIQLPDTDDFKQFCREQLGNELPQAFKINDILLFLQWKGARLRELALT